MKGLERPEVTEPILLAAFEVHAALGPGLSSHIYRRALATECQLSQGLHGAWLLAKEEHEIEIKYRGASVGKQRLDLVVQVIDVMAVPRVDGTRGDLIVVEVKHFAVTDAPSARIQLARSQLQTYLAAANIRMGLVLNFGLPKLGIHRVVNPHFRPNERPIP